MEIWKDVVGYEFIYQVSNLGNVKSLKFWKERILRWWRDRDWYLSVSLSKNSVERMFIIHRLVAFYFISNPENKPQVNHKNWIKTDNKVENLEWCTNLENQQHAWRTWLKKVENNHFIIKNPNKWKFWKDHPKSKKVYQYSLSWEFIKQWNSIVDASKKLWIHQWNISACCKWRQKTTGGFTWKFA